MQIGETGSLSYEEFQTLYQQAIEQKKHTSLTILQQTYPDYYKRAFVEQMPPIPDWDSSSSPYPILRLPPGYSPSIINMVFYLTGNSKTSHICMDYMFEHLQSVKRRNIRTDEIIYIFDEALLWEQFFMKEPVLSSILQSRKIYSFQELVARTQDYFAKRLSSY